ncbi:hypothetical protein ACFL6E_02220 [Candidatus Neomarinimicrobiota bacterium]
MKILILTILAMSMLMAQDGIFADGYDWQRISRITREYPEYNGPLKQQYLKGILDSRLYFYLQARAENLESANNVYRDYLGQLSPTELTRGLDVFYSDPAVLYLPIISSMNIVSLKAAGLPDSLVQNYTEASKHWYNSITIGVEGEFPIHLEGIDIPAFPLPPKPPTDFTGTGQPHRWYYPDTLLLP